MPLKGMLRFRLVDTRTSGLLDPSILGHRPDMFAAMGCWIGASDGT